MKRQIIVDHMDEASKKVLASFLEELNPELWMRSEEQLRQDLFV
ncbi:YwhD family protein OS=Lysinibacillus sphaericus OX=1421 GN=LS41612_20310 PE=4 SV=1 [Lysinibacillus sphaericus]